MLRVTYCSPCVFIRQQRSLKSTVLRIIACCTHTITPPHTHTHTHILPQVHIPGILRIIFLSGVVLGLPYDLRFSFAIAMCQDLDFSMAITQDLGGEQHGMIDRDRDGIKGFRLYRR